MRTKSTIFHTFYAYIEVSKNYGRKPIKWRLSPLAFELAKQEMNMTHELLHNVEPSFLPPSILGIEFEVDPAVLWVELALEDNRMIRDGVLQFDK